MSLVTQERWESLMGTKVPMPEGCTSEQMFAMFDVLHKMEHKEYAAEQIKWYEGLWREQLPKYKEAEAWKDFDDESAKKFEDRKQIMALIKEGILFWRGELHDN